jgi:hypothetical protein
MNNTLIFLCIASTLLAFSIIVVSTSPSINIFGNGWKDLNCQQFSDFHDYIEEKGAAATKEEYLKLSKEGRNVCNRKKAMHGLEYASIVCDIVLGFICAFLSLLHYLGVGSVYEKVTGIIGIASGVICFILTLVYVIYSGYIFTNDNFDIYISNSGPTISKNYISIPKLDDDGVVAKYDSSEGKFKCVNYDGNDESKFYAKYNELGQKRYNYNKDFIDTTSKFSKCKFPLPTSLSTSPSPPTSPSFSHCTNGIGRVAGSDCDVVYVYHDDIRNKYVYDKWVTSIIFDTLNIVLSIGLAVFGFLLFKGSNSDGPTPLK